MPEDQKPLVEAPQPFHMTLARIEGGALHADLTDAMRDLNNELAHMAATNGKAKGSISLKLVFNHTRNGTVEVIADYKVDSPKVPREPTTFFVTPGANLSVENPRQQSLPLRSIDSPVERAVEKLQEVGRSIGAERVEVRTVPQKL